MQPWELNILVFGIEEAARCTGWEVESWLHSPGSVPQSLSFLTWKVRVWMALTPWDCYLGQSMQSPGEWGQSSQGPVSLCILSTQRGRRLLEHSPRAVILSPGCQPDSPRRLYSSRCSGCTPDQQLWTSEAGVWAANILKLPGISCWYNLRPRLRSSGPAELLRLHQTYESPGGLWKHRLWGPAPEPLA